MNRTLLATAICATLMMGGSAHAQDTGVQAPSTAAPDQTSPPPAKKEKKDDAKNLDAVTVTGSLIPQAQVQTASPVITITSKDIETQGFKDVYDALKAQPVATGSVQGSQDGGTFTQGASTISLFGLDPGFTLILINGHPLADYPLPYNGTGNFVDLSTIPTSVVDHIDILTGGQSSLYGSSAIAGVINIVLKKHMEGMDLSYRAGDYSEGGGQNQRFTLSGGTTKDNWDVSYALQVDNQRPIWYFQRDFTDSTHDDPSGMGVASRTFLQLGLLDPTGYLNPGAATCAPLSYLFNGSTAYDYRPGHGYYCGSYNEPGYATMLNQNFDANAYLNTVYHINDYNEAYAEIEYSFSKPTFSSGTQFWSYFNPQLANSANSYAQYFWNNKTNNLELWQRIFSPEELGGLDVNDNTIITKQYNVNLGLRGSIGSSDWGYDAYYNRSQVSTFSSQLQPLNAPLINYYLGKQQGTDPLGYGFAAFTPNNNFYTPLTPAQYRSFSDFVKSDSISWTQNFTGTITDTDLFTLPAGKVGFAAVAGYGDQAFNNPVDPRLAAGEFVGLTGTSGAGSRDHYDAGTELRVPILTWLTADASARYDDYQTTDRSDAKPTYKMGLEFRPFSTLLLRTTFATAFRAPNMEDLFAKNSGFFTQDTDYFLCRTQDPTTPIANCPYANEELFGHNNGTNDLKSVSSKSFGYGLVWSPDNHFNFKADYQHISINNEIQTLSIDDLLQTEADCRIGVSPGGQAYNIDSPTCVDALSRVTRFPANYPFSLAANQIQYVNVGPVNIASESLNGVQSSMDYSFDIDKLGTVDLGTSYYVELHHDVINKPGDPAIDQLHDYNSSEFKSNVTATATWTVGNWSTTVHMVRNGKSVNNDQTGIVPALIVYNGSVRYNLAGHNAYIQLTGNNLFDRRPPVDASEGWPYYNTDNYNAFGRSVFIEFGMHLGPGKVSE